MAQREFLAAVANKGFVIGLLIMPAIIAVLVVVMPRLMSAQALAGPRRGGRHRPDRPRLRRSCEPALTPEAITRRRRKARGVPSRTRRRRSVPSRASRSDAARSSGDRARLRRSPIVERPATADVQSEKHWLTDAGGGASSAHLALVVIHPDAVSAEPAQAEYGTYDLYVPDNLDERHRDGDLRCAARGARRRARARATTWIAQQVEAVDARAAAAVGDRHGRRQSGGPTRVQPGRCRSSCGSAGLRRHDRRADADDVRPSRRSRAASSRCCWRRCRRSS